MAIQNSCQLLYITFFFISFYYFLRLCLAIHDIKNSKFSTHLNNQLLLLWHKHFESLGKSNVFIHVFILVCQTSSTAKTQRSNRQSPNIVKAWQIVKCFEVATKSAASLTHFTVHNELLEISNISSDSDNMDEEPTKESSHNNPEEAANYMEAVNNLLDKFVNDIHGFNPYAH